MRLAVDVANKIAASDGKRSEVIDLWSLFLYDWQVIAARVKRTGRAKYINEDTEFTNPMRPSCACNDAV